MPLEPRLRAHKPAKAGLESAIVVEEMDATASESEPLLTVNNTNSAGVDHAQQRQAVHEPQIENRWQQFATDVGKWTVQHLPGIKVLLIFVPLGFAAGLLRANAVLVATFNFLAIIPLSALVSDLSDKLSDSWGPLVGGLINATFGNTVELIVGVLAITYNDIYVAQSTMVGSILSDILAVLGGCLVAAAHGSSILNFNGAVVDTLSSLMNITSMALILPTILYTALTKTAKTEIMIRSFSRATAVVLLVIYVIYLYFQLRTHKEVFLIEADDEAASSSGSDDDGQEGNSGSGEEEQPEQEEGPETSSQTTYSTAIALVVSAAAIMVCSRYFILSLDATARFTHSSKTFIATILIPIASNAPECSAVITASRKGRINYAISVIVGSILQIALFVLPILVIVGWTLGKPMTLNFDISQTSLLFLAVLMVNQVLQEGKYTYLHGIMLLSLYAIIAVAIFIQPFD